MGITYITFLISSLAIAGIPPFSGFFSKDEILLVAFHHDKVLWAIASLASVMTAFYMFRLLYLTFFKTFRGTEDQKSHLHESPGLMTFPLIALAVLATIGGLISLPGNSWLNDYLAPVMGERAMQAHALGTTEYILMGVAVIGGLIGIGIAYSEYIRKSELPPIDVEMEGAHKLLYNKYYVDEFYDKLFVAPINALSKFLRDTVETALSGLVYGFGKATIAVSQTARVMQNGNVGFYLFAFVVGLIAIITYLFYSKIV